MEPTAEQRQAIHTEGRPLMVEAGAGTGKTWVLVQRFIHLLERHPEWPLSSIVAITFTEKATREMRSRIREAIEKSADGTPEGSLWNDRRLEIEELRVSTIHGLCSTILRENSVSAGLDPQFTVLDEQEADLLKDEAVRQTLSDLAEKDDPGLALLSAFQVWDLQTELVTLLEKRGTVQELFDELPDAPALLETWRQGFEKFKDDVWQQQLETVPDLQDALRLLPGIAIVDPADLLAGAVRLAQEGCQLLAENDLSAAAKSWQQINLTGGRAASWGGTEQKNDLKLLLKAIRNAANALDSAGALKEIDQNDVQAAQWLQLWNRIWQALCASYDRLKDERQALDFDDLELRAEALLSQRPRSQRLQDYIDSIEHLMVDEFQDTNHRQKRIVYALAHPEQGGRLFVVGDAKQSIYRFRQAQVSVFNDTSAEVETITGQSPIPLSRSFRTHAGLLPGLNDLFQELLQPLGTIHEPFEARPGALSAARPAPAAQVSAPSPVELVILPKKDAADETVDAIAGRRWEAYWLAKRLKRLWEEQFLVWDKDGGLYRPFDYGDAAILFRATTNIPIYEEALKEANLPYLTVSGRGYYDRSEVRDLIALLTCLHDSRDNLNLAAVLRSPLFSLSDETLYRLRWHSSAGELLETARPLALALGDPPPGDQLHSVAFANQVLSDLWSLAGRVDVWRLLRQALDLTGFEATLIFSDAALRGGGRQYSNVQKFLALARDRGGADLSLFLRRLQDLQVREAREGEALGGQPEGGAVQLMSIHAAKGLEFPVVALADLGRQQRRGGGSPRILFDPAYGLVCKARDEYGDWQAPASYTWAAWLDSRMEEAESKRLLYVACTRAADLLILSGREGQKNSWLHQLLSIWEIEPQGELEEQVPFGTNSMTIFRPQDQPEQTLPSQPVPRSAPGPAAIPRLALPLTGNQEGRVIGVTRLIEEVAGKKFEKLKKLEPSNQASIGQTVHHALRNWSCLSLPYAELTNFLEDHVRQEDVSEDDVDRTVRRSRFMLYNLKNSDFYSIIQRAKNRYHELPFTLRANGYVIPGSIDIVFQEKDLTWHIVDWKTEYIVPGEDFIPPAEHLQQMAVYSAAVEEVLGQVPQAALGYLNPRWHYCRLDQKQLEQARRLLFSS